MGDVNIVTSENKKTELERLELENLSVEKKFPYVIQKRQQSIYSDSNPYAVRDILYNIASDSLRNHPTETEEDDSQLEYELVPGYQIVSNKGIEKYTWKNSTIKVKGYAYFDDFPASSLNEISRTILINRVIEKDGNTTYHTLYECETTSTDSSINSYLAEIDFGTINNGHPLENGKYQLFIRLKQFIAGEWIAQEFKIGKANHLEVDFSYSTKNKWYQAHAITTYSFAVTQKINSDTLMITSTKLSKVNPASLIVDEDIVKKESKILLKIKRRIFKLTYNLFTKVFPIKRNQVAFLSDSRIDLTGNFEYIYDEMKERNSFLEPVFFLKQHINDPKTLREYIELAKAIATSRYVLLDDFYPIIYPLDIREGVDLVQVWHAAGAFKTFGYSRVGMPGGPKLSSRNHRNYSKALVSSSNVVSNYAEGFGIDQKRVEPLGVARTDLFFDDTKKQQIVNRLFDEMLFLRGKKIVLFAPTFRGNGQNSAYYPFNWLDYQKLYEELHSQGFIFLFKIHPFVKNSPDIPYEYSDFFYDVSDYREVNDLLLVSDVMITDYSSVVFEYSLLHRKTIFFAPDLSDYMETRNFYVDYLNFVPGPRVSDNSHLIEEILKYSDIDQSKLNAFLNFYFEDLDGKSSKRIVDMLEDNVDAVETADETEEFTEDGKWIPRWGEQK